MADRRHARRYIRALNKWRKDYERMAARKDERAYSILEELALIDVLLEQLVRRAEEADVPEWRTQVAARFEGLKSAIASGKPDQMRAALTWLGQTIEAGVGADAQHAFLRVELERRANLALRAQDTATRGAEQVTRNQAVALFREFFRGIRLWCANWTCPSCGQRDREAYGSLSAPLIRLVGGIGVEQEEMQPRARRGGPDRSAG